MYDRLAPFYEWEHHDFQDDIHLYLGYARASNGPILDAACGTGRVSIPLAEAGYGVTGVDSSQAMLALARAGLEKVAPAKRPPLVRADLRTVELKERFGLVLVTLGSFHHLLCLGDQRQALRRMAAHLAPGGLLVIDLVNPSPQWLAAGDGTLVHQLTAPYPGPDGPDTLTKLVARTTHFETQTERSQLIYDRTSPRGTVRRWSFLMETRLLFRYEAELLLEESGFLVRDLYGDYDLESYQASSPRMVIAAERR